MTDPLAARSLLFAPGDSPRKLEKAGVIRGYVALVDPHAVGVDVTAFVEVFVEHPRFEPAFIRAVTAVAEVQEVHHVTGEFSLMLKVRTASITSLRRLLIDTINTIRGVRQTRTVIVLATAKEDTRVAIDDTADTSNGGANGGAGATRPRRRIRRKERVR